MNDREKIEDCYRQMYRGIIEKDRAEFIINRREKIWLKT